MRLKRSRVLVTGGAGFIGSNLISRLLTQGVQIKASIHRKEPVIEDGRIEYVRADLTRSEDCERVVKGIDYVFMCAASTSGAAVIASNPLVHVTPNIVMNSRMLEASYQARVEKFVWISSSVGYPPTGNRPVREEEFFNGDPYDTYFASGWMKRYTEILCRMYMEKLRDPISTVVLRPTNIYGPHDKFDLGTSHVTAAQIRKVVERHDPITVWGSGNDIRDLLYIDDFIDAVLLAAQKLNSRNYQPLNIGLGRAYSVKEVLQMLLRLDGYADARIRFDSSKPSMIPVRVVSIARAKKLLGFSPKVSLREGLKKTLRWYRESRSLLRRD